MLVYVHVSVQKDSYPLFGTCISFALLISLAIWGWTSACSSTVRNEHMCLLRSHIGAYYEQTLLIYQNKKRKRNYAYSGIMFLPLTTFFLFRLAQSTILLWSYAIFVIIRILASFMWRRYGSPSCISIFMILKLMWSAGITGKYHACASATAFDLRTYVLSSFFIFRSCWKVGNCAFWLSDHFVLYVRFTS